MTDRELMQQALEKLEFFDHMKNVSKDTQELITVLRERLAQPEHHDPIGDAQDKLIAEQAAQQYDYRIKYDRGCYKCQSHFFPGNCKEPKQPAQEEPVAWRDHVEQRLLTWRQSFVNKSGDQLALDDFMDKRSLDDLIDFVCDAYTDLQPVKFNCTVVDDDHPEGVPLSQWGQQSKQKPFCYHDGRNIVGKEYAHHCDVFPLYTDQQPEQEPLTDEDIAVIAAACGGLASDFVVSVARAIEAAHGITGDANEN